MKQIHGLKPTQSGLLAIGIHGSKADIKRMLTRRVGWTARTQREWPSVRSQRSDRAGLGQKQGLKRTLAPL
jgi:hypothetical protein